jgi:membrane-associated phospholipid phosphatase
VAVSALAVTAATLPLDQSLRDAMQRRGVQRSRAAGQGADVFNAWGSPGVFVASGALWAAGAARHDTTLLRVGKTSLLGIVVASGVTAAGKYTFGRARPYLSPNEPFDMRAFRGGEDGYTSFPSGHTTAAFAFASATSAVLRDRRTPHRRAITVALYSAAALTGAARMYRDRHWASDVVAGASVGTIGGWLAARWEARRAWR